MKTNQLPPELVEKMILALSKIPYQPLTEESKQCAQIAVDYAEEARPKWIKFKDEKPNNVGVFFAKHPNFGHGILIKTESEIKFKSHSSEFNVNESTVFFIHLEYIRELI